MSERKPQAQSTAQAGSSGEAAGVGSAVGGVRSSDEHNWLDLWAMNPETRAYLSSARRDAACSHASSRREGAGDGPQGIATASPRSQQRLRAAVRAKLNHWTLGRRIPEVMTGLNRLLRGWSGYFHYRHSRRVMGRLNWQVRDRVKRWLWRKQAKKRALWSDYPDERLQAQYGLWSLPEKAAWKHP
jgi:hypothetical protein